MHQQFKYAKICKTQQCVLFLRDHFAKHRRNLQGESNFAYLKLKTALRWKNYHHILSVRFLQLPTLEEPEADMLLPSIYGIYYG